MRIEVNRGVLHNGSVPEGAGFQRRRNRADNSPTLFKSDGRNRARCQQGKNAQKSVLIVSEAGLPRRDSDFWRRAFTLIEILVVVAVIAVLAGLMFPVLGGMREKASAAKCLSNMRQIGVGVLQYVSENDGRFPQQNSGPVAPPSTTWWGAIGPYINWREPYKSGANAALGSIGHCPSHTKNPGSFSYRANGGTSGSLYRGVIVPVSASAVRVAQISQLSKIILLYEVHTVCEWPQADVYWAGVGVKPFTPVYTFPPHGKNFHHLWCDGHADSSPKARGWPNYNTSTNWNP